MKKFLIPMLISAFFIGACAGLRDDAPEGGASNDMADTGCDECGKQYYDQLFPFRHFFSPFSFLQ